MDKNTVVPAATPEVQARRRSRRPAISCTLCHKRKIRCNRAKPCSSCLRSRSGAAGCVYENAIPNQPIMPSVEPPREHSQIQSSDEPLAMEKQNQNQEAQFQPLTPYSSNASRPNSTIHPSLSSSLAASSWTESSTLASASGQYALDTEVIRLRLRIEQLESRLSKQSQSHSQQSPVPAPAPSHSPSPAPNPGAGSDMEIISSRIGGTFHILTLKDAPSSQNRPPIAHNLSHKTRIFGQSHWAVSTAHLVRCHQASCSGERRLN